MTAHRPHPAAPHHARHRRAGAAGARLALLVAVLGLTSVLAACGQDETAASTSSTDAPGTTAPSDSVRLEAPAELTSAESRLLKVGEDDSRTYGWNKLVGPTSTNLGDFDVEMLGNVDYLNGTGPFFGFVTLTDPAGDLLGLRMDGQAAVVADGGTTLEATFEVIDGTGRYLGVSGTGDLTGTRTAEVGAPIEIVITVDLTGLDA